MSGYSELTVICISKQGAALIAGKLGNSSAEVCINNFSVLQNI